MDKCGAWTDRAQIGTAWTGLSGLAVRMWTAQPLCVWQRSYIRWMRSRAVHSARAVLFDTSSQRTLPQRPNTNPSLPQQRSRSAQHTTARHNTTATSLRVCTRGTKRLATAQRLHLLSPPSTQHSGSGSSDSLSKQHSVGVIVTTSSSLRSPAAVTCPVLSSSLPSKLCFNTVPVHLVPSSLERSVGLSLSLYSACRERADRVHFACRGRAPFRVVAS